MVYLKSILLGFEGVQAHQTLKWERKMVASLLGKLIAWQQENTRRINFKGRLRENY